MVRFSKLPFRHVVRSYGADLVFSPMIMADSFTASQKARDVELTTNRLDQPMIVQFAANTAKQFGDAAELVAGKVAGVDLNCGCPQRYTQRKAPEEHYLRSGRAHKRVCARIDTARYVRVVCVGRWAIQEGVGCALLKKPELVKSMVHEAKERSGLHVSIKIRIDQDLAETVKLVKLAESVGVSWITLHGRCVPLVC